MSWLINWFLNNRYLVLFFYSGILLYGLWVTPFDFSYLPKDRDRISIDALPDLGENQQIVFTKWMGRSPQDIEDQLTYPLSTLLQGISGVKTIRSYSYFGFSSVYVIFDEEADVYWARSRILEKITSAQGLPPNVTPTLGPDATGLGQIFWYTVEGEGFSLAELRSIQDFYIKYQLQSSIGVSEVASVGGFLKEYHIEVNPELISEYKISLKQVSDAVAMANLDISAGTVEVNNIEYLVRGKGYLKGIGDLENVVVREINNTPIYLKNIATINIAPALRRGVLDKGGAEVVGGVVVARYGENPQEVIAALKEKIASIERGLPKKKLADGRQSQVKIIPFYDRSILINETLGTLQNTLRDEMLITILVILSMGMQVGISFLVSLMLPLGILIVFSLMKTTGIDSHIMSLSGIAIAIGTIVDMGIIISENIQNKVNGLGKVDEKKFARAVVESTGEVARPVMTAILTTVISFLPIFFMEGPEAKLFIPLAWTKTFALLVSLVLALTLIPVLAKWFLDKSWLQKAPFILIGVVLMSAFVFMFFLPLLGMVLLGLASYRLLVTYAKNNSKLKLSTIFNGLIFLGTGILLVHHWQPLGTEVGFLRNFVGVFLMLGFILGFFLIFYRQYPRILRWALKNKSKFLIAPLSIFILGLLAWFGFASIFSFVPKTFSLISNENQQESRITFSVIWQWGEDIFPGMQKEFMPKFDEGDFLYMPTSAPHLSIGGTVNLLSEVDKRIQSIPEVNFAVGKIGRVDSALDPAPLNMIETVISYKSEYGTNAEGKKIRQWRPHIKNSDDIWKEIVAVSQLPGLTSAPKDYPISIRNVMLQTGVRSSLAIKMSAPNLELLGEASVLMEKTLAELEKLGVNKETISGEKVLGKPYLEIIPDRRRLSRYGLNTGDFFSLAEMAIGGSIITKVIEGRESYDVLIRYQREKRDSLEAIYNLPFHSKEGSRFKLKDVARVIYKPGPQVIKSEDGFLTSFVIFGKQPGISESELLNKLKKELANRIDQGSLQFPQGSHYEFTGTYLNQIRSEKRLGFIIPLSIAIIFLLLFLQFRSLSTTFLIFSAILVALTGGMLWLYLYGQDWFLNIPFWGESIRYVFNVKTYHLSAAVWVGFLALFGIASDDGVLVATYLDDSFKSLVSKKLNQDRIREAVLAGAKRRSLPCLMTSATTIIALLPIITSHGRGSDVMIPMVLPILGGMFCVLITMFIVPVGYSYFKEKTLEKNVN